MAPSCSSLWEHRYSLVVPEGEGPGGNRSGSVAMEEEEEEAAGDQVWEQQGGLSPESRLGDSTTERPNRCQNALVLLNATMTPNTHRGVHHRTRQHCCRDVALTGAVSGEASAAAATAGDAAPASWR